MMGNWEDDNYEMVTEYNQLQDYREAQEKLQEFDYEVRHRIFHGRCPNAPA
jgi:hypothetical protein